MKSTDANLYFEENRIEISEIFVLFAGKPWPTIGRLLAEALRNDDRGAVRELLLILPTPSEIPADRVEQAQRLIEIIPALRALEVPFTKPPMDAATSYLKAGNGKYIGPDFQLRESVLVGIRNRPDPIERFSAAALHVMHDTSETILTCVTRMTSGPIAQELVERFYGLRVEQAQLNQTLSNDRLDNDRSSNSIHLEDPLTEFCRTIMQASFGPFLLKRHFADVTMRFFAALGDSSKPEIEHALVRPAIDQTIAHGHPGHVLALLDQILQTEGTQRGTTVEGRPIVCYPMHRFSLEGNVGERQLYLKPDIWKLQAPGMKPGTTLQKLFGVELKLQRGSGCPGAVEKTDSSTFALSGSRTAAQTLSSLYGLICSGEDFLDYSINLWRSLGLSNDGDCREAPVIAI